MTTPLCPLRAHAFVAVTAVTLAGTACGGAGPIAPDEQPPASPPGARLVFTVQPNDTRVGEIVSPGVRVAIHDATGNVVGTASPRVTLALGNDAGGATLGGTVDVEAVAGIATFDDLSIDQPGDGFTLVASAPELIEATSDPFDVSSPPLSIDERQVLFDAVQQLMADLPGDDLAADKQVVIDFLSSRTEFDDVGLSANGTIWAVFSDGVPYFIMDNHSLVLGDEATAVSAERIAPGRAHRVPAARAMPLVTPPGASADQRASNPPTGLPKPLKFRLLNGFGDFFDETDPSENIKQMLEAHDYLDAGGSRTATVEVLRTVSADAVLYFRSHGGDAILNDVQNTKVDGLWTATPVSHPEPAHIFDDLLAGRLGYATELNSRRLGLWPEEATHYMITADFIRHYWGTFGENSFVYFDGCWGATMQTIKDALRAKNVSVFASWNHVSRSGPNGRTAQFVFDRLLGANQFEPEDPMQRPFDYEALARQFGPGSPYGYDDFVSPKSGNRITPTLEFSKLNGDFGLLAPSIQRLAVDEFQNELTIHGSFGLDPGGKGTVTIEGDPQTIQSWTEREIVVSGVDPTAAGYVVVTAWGHESNAVPLTRWEGGFRYTVDLGNVWAPGLTQDVVCDLHFRADVHGYRDTPGQAPIEPLVHFVPTESSSCEFAMYGSGEDAVGNVITLSGGGVMMRADNQSVSTDYFGASGFIDVGPKHVSAFMTLGAEGEIEIVPPEGPSITVPSLLISDPWTLFGEASCPPNIPPAGFQLTTIPTSGQGFGIASGQRTGTGGCGITDIPTTLTWSDLPAAFPPMPTDRR